LRSKRSTLADLADAEQTNSIFVADLLFAEQKNICDSQHWKLISLDISQNDSIGIIDLKPTPFVGYDIGMHLFDNVSIAPPLQGIVVRILDAVSSMQFCANLVPTLPDAAAVKTVKV